MSIFNHFKSTNREEVLNLNLVLVILIAFINGLDLLVGDGLVKINLWDMISQGGWVNLLLFPFRLAAGWLQLIFFLYFIWILGQQLEEEMGSRIYLLYLLCGCFFVLLGSLFYPLTAYCIYLSIFMAIAFRYPDDEILLFFFLPVKMKWAAALVLAFTLYSPFRIALYSGDLFPLLGPILGLSNFIVFHFRDIVRRIQRG